MFYRWLCHAVFLILVLRCWTGQAYSTEPETKTPDLSQQPGVVAADFIFEKAPFRQCHASTIVETPTGLVAAWFGGTSEKHPDVGIWLSRHIAGSWTPPVEVANGIQDTRAGESPKREGLIDTPKRVVEAYRDWFSGYAVDPKEYLRRTFEEVAGYDEMIVLRDIEFESFCEHHMAPIIGRAHVGYLPTDKVVGISKLARVVDAYARRFQVQEKLTAQIAHCIDMVLKPRGVGVVIDATHQCMTTRGVHKRGVSMISSQMLGTFRKDARTRAEFLRFVDIHAGRT